MSVLSQSFAWLVGVGQAAGETANERVSRQILVLGAVLMSGGGLLWGSLVLALGLSDAALIPYGYVVISVVDLWILARTRALAPIRTVQILATMLLPFMFQWRLGGFLNSGGVMLWALIALIGSLTLTSSRQGWWWAALYAALTIASGVFDAEVAARSGLAPSVGFQVLFFVINVTAVSGIVFTLGLTITLRQRRAIEALEEERDANRVLNTRLTEMVASREQDIERLRCAEAALTSLANGLEAEVQARTAELASALVRAEAGTRAKGEFLATMSHEIRTPLNGILGTTELLQLTALDEDQRDCLRLIRRSGDLLLSILNDVLDFSKIEAGRLELSPRPFRLRAELEGLVALHRSQAVENGVELRLELPSDLPEAVSGDPDRLVQVLGNLLGNAVKFTHRGEITVRVDFQPECEGLRLRFMVRDSGVGVSPENLARLFQPFMQADSAITRRYGGTGLGLAICARLVELLGGQISVESVVGEGSTFRFDVLVQRAEVETARRADISVGPLVDGVGLRVLLAEDNPVNQTIALRMLRRLGCEASLAPNGEVAVAMAQAAAFDLVLMDMQMPVRDGLSSARAIRALPLAQQPRIIALTANAFGSDREACLAAGMDDFLAKPLGLEQLRTQLRRLQFPRRAEASGGLAGVDGT